MQREAFVLAIDMGSTWCKAAYVDWVGRIVSEGRAYTRGGPPFGHNAADLERSWAAVVTAVRQANEGMRQSEDPLDLAAIGISCRKAPGIWLDANDEPVNIPRRAVEEAGREDIDESYASEVWRDSDPFAYGYGMDLIGNTRWLWRRFPEQWSRVRKAGTLHTWLVYRLTGRWVTSTTAGPGQLAWPTVVTELTGLPIEAFPRVVESYRPVATLTPEAAADLDLPVTTPVVTGTHDGAAANIGVGAIRPGDACLTLGTNGVLRVVTGARIPRQFGYPIVEGRWAMVRDIVGIALYLDAVVAAIDGQGIPVQPRRHRKLTIQAQQIPVGAHDLRLPLRYPALPAEEVIATYPPGVVYRAALESIALAFRGLIEVAKGAGASPRRYSATGGATANRLLLTIMSGCIEAPIFIIPDEAGTRGAAILAAVGAAWYSSIDAAVRAMIPDGSGVVAPPELMDAYANLVQTVEFPPGVAPGDKVRGQHAGES